MIKELFKLLIVILAIFGWIFFFMSVFILLRWNRFINKNPNAQDIIKHIFIRTIFLEN